MQINARHDKKNPLDEEEKTLHKNIPCRAMIVCLYFLATLVALHLTPVSE